MAHSRDSADDPQPDRTLYVGGVAGAREEVDRTLMPAAVRKKAYLAVASGSRKFSELTLTEETTTIGRGPGVELELEEPSASRRHAAVTWTDEGYVLRDLDSTNGTYLRGTLENAERPLYDGDCFRIGGTEIVFHAARRGRL